MTDAKLIEEMAELLGNILYQVDDQGVWFDDPDRIEPRSHVKIRLSKETVGEIRCAVETARERLEPPRSKEEMRAG